MELTVDGRRCDSVEAEGAVWGFDAAELTDPVSRREGRAAEFLLPPTGVNRAVFSDAELPAGRVRFNEDLHEAILTTEGECLLRGEARLLEASEEGYRIEIRGGAAKWAKRAAVAMFDAIPLEWEGRLTPEGICASWDRESPVKFLPVHCDGYEAEPSSTGLAAVRRILSTGDYHPFLKIDALLRAVFADAGYAVESRFMEGDFFRSLHMSGAYAATDTAAVERRMGFFARRKGDASATADANGKVYASPYVAASTVGNFADAFVPLEPDDAGKPLTDVYANSGCLRMEEGRLLFRPTVAVKAGFEFYVRYVTDYRIRNRSRLTGFDAAYLGSGVSAEFPLANPYPDRRGKVTGGYRYRVVVFGHEEGSAYRIVGGTEAGAIRVLGSFAARSAEVTMPSGAVTADPVLQVFSGGVWRFYSDDWALYDGYVGETGRIEAEVRLTTPPEEVTPVSPRDFRTVYFYGAEPEMTLTLRQACTLRPLFSQVPGVGSRLAFADVARHRIRQSELLDAVCHLFNLRVFTDEEAKTVFIEPEPDFYDRTRLFDWSGKIDPGSPVVLADRALEEHESRRYGYQTGEGAATRLGGEGEPFGDWVSRTASCAAKQGEQALTNPLFAPTLNAAGSVPGAPSAQLPNVGDRDDASGGGFTPRIVSFCGMELLPEGERWDFPAPAGTYPLAGFHLPEEGLTLCFGDRDGAEGLHRWYDVSEERRSLGLRLSVRLRLSPREAEALRHRGDGVNAGIDSLFLLRVGGVPLRCILRSAEGGDPAVGSVACVFETLVGETV